MGSNQPSQPPPPKMPINHQKEVKVIKFIYDQQGRQHLGEQKHFTKKEYEREVQLERQQIKNGEFQPVYSNAVNVVGPAEHPQHSEINGGRMEAKLNRQMKGNEFGNPKREEYQVKQKSGGFKEVESQNLFIKPKTSVLRQNDLIQKEELNEKKAHLISVVKEFQRKIQEALQFGKKMKDPKRYREFESEALQNYLQKLSEMKFPQTRVNQQGKSVKLIVGRISSGKSSLINSLFGLKLDVGVGETTLQTGLVYSDQNVEIYDTPGECETFNTRSLEVVEYIAASNEVYILYPDSLKVLEHLVRVVATIKPNSTYFVRTQCDNFSKTSNRTLEEELEVDTAVLKGWGIQNIKIFTTSTKPGHDFDNESLKKFMTEGKL